MKKSTILIFILFISIFLFFISCEKTIDGSFPEFRRKLVVNAKFLNDSTLTAYVFHSKNVLDTQPIAFDETAKVVLYENNQVIENLTLTSIISRDWQFRIPYCYKTQLFKPLARHQYKLVVTDQENMSVECAVTMPPEIPIISVDTTTIETEEGTPPYPYKRTFLQLKIKFADPAQSTDYYSLSIYQDFQPIFYNDSTPVLRYWDPQVRSECDDPILKDEFNSMTYKIFSDKLFNGMEKQITLRVDKGGLASSASILYIQLSRVTVDNYKYVMSKQKFSENEGNPISEPVPIYSNITGGLGIALAETRSSQKIVFNLKK
jgi:hypothetical protein